MLSKFDSITSIVDYLREPIASPAIKDSSNKINNGLKVSKKQRKTKGLTNTASTLPSPPHRQPQEEIVANIEVLPKGRVSSLYSIRYGPITVNPRKLPSKTLFTGRRSKYEILSTDEEERRRDRRERNRVAATKCREKRETVLSQLEDQHHGDLQKYKDLLKEVQNLEQHKQYLESVLNNHLNECPLLNPSFSMVFGDTGFLSTITDAPPPLLPSYPQPNFHVEDDEFSHILDPSPALTNSAYESDNTNSILFPTQEQNVQPLPSTTSGIDRLVNGLQTPTISMESTNNHSMLFNSAIGSSCAQQHSHSSDDDSLPPARTNPYVY
uniref:Basic region leucine zipper-like protein n=1 Tax=Adineta vaga TaxID=104782 RepID=B3G4K9_ADIVA|nr:basic region leucine zipper-like protein [Adineta vaga]